MSEISRRNFLKSSAVVAFGISNLDAKMLEFPQQENLRFTYFIKDSMCNVDLGNLQADKILEVNGDIRAIYGDLKLALQSGAIIGSISSEATFFVLSTMAADYGLRVAYSAKSNNVRTWILAPKGVAL
ncbi:transcriptional initiation protein Tat [Helicobacter sp. MIT 05-5294]|uniref:twin-arginine translocation signal domain-containing protein n=1 Tax=Helicobacter sp. MIT 05-5294 TaxID=1548150 RepID=UPI00051FE49E|nr:transcriptional initiation protein Tat [Helicobacter sp. MIT 05-5294]TLD89112.1 transcriptional initiation protein Tat [Helicobacter sp. MIT 05-5294]